MSRLGTTFHESFSLVRSQLAKTLPLAVDAPLSFARIRDQTDLGMNYAKAMPRYADGCGLIDPSTGMLSSFGRRVLEYDPQLETPTTQWLLHYHMSSPSGPGPAYWHRAICERLRPGHSTTADKMRSDIPELSGLADRTARTAISVLIGTYTKHECLGPLGLLERSREGIEVREPGSPPIAAIAFALSHAWRGSWPDLSVVPLDAFHTPGGFASVLYLTPESLEDSLLQLSQQGIVELWRTAPPFQVVRKWTDPDALADLLHA